LKRTLALGLSFLGGTAVLAAGALGLALAQVNCEAFPAGPARTDCYVGLNRINRQQSEIFAGVAQQQAGAATYRKVTGKLPYEKRRRAASR
jgi:hypothetical protein